MDLKKLIVVLSMVCCLSACVTPKYEGNTPLSILSTQILPNVLSETSGLLCDANGIVSLNDSGNDPELFWVSYDGNMSNSVSLPAVNKDWEALATDDNFIYVADVGNNRGKRESLQIYKVAKTNPQNIETLNISYKDNNAQRNMSYAHDFDAEAMVVVKGKLLLFSKSWKTKVARVYEVNTEESHQTLLPVNYIEGLPGVITGADFDSRINRFVVVGYLSNPFGNFDTFMAHVSEDFSVLEIWPLNEFKQVEGVCVSPSGSYFFSEEAINGQPATLTEANVVSVQ